MRLISLVLLLASLLGAQAPQNPKPTAFRPKPQGWKLEVQGLSGGWHLEPKLTCRVKVSDPEDPSPPQEQETAEEGPEFNDYSDEYEEARPVPQAAPVKDWRIRRLVYWFNGIKQELTIQVGYTTRLYLDSANGENRLELWQPDSNKRLVRTWWVGTSRLRLQVRLFELNPQGEESRSWFSGLQIVEPDHTESIGWEPTPSGGRNHGNRYEHSTPLPGTYTVRWFDPNSGVEGYEWGGGHGGGDKRPRKIVAEITLDGGTEFERRWRFERFVMPGTRRITLGSFDVED